MDIKPIRTEEDYRAAKGLIDTLWGAEIGTPEGDILDVYIILVEDYEKRNVRTLEADPVETILYYMESRGLTNKDMIRFIGSPSRVSEILNRKRHLTLEMIRNLEQGLGIPAKILIQPYYLVGSIRDYSSKETITKDITRPFLSHSSGSYPIPSRMN